MMKKAQGEDSGVYNFFVPLERYPKRFKGRILGESLIAAQAVIDFDQEPMLVRK
ncbi:hypothetical protein [Rhizobium sp. NFACC06-2]|uniref:hypothetical protein n=1 Tax=Rhizobium sp. NFACC06-2 TaxID=1566264 RepID=UPI00165FA2B8|nr:hypothetical protein [Rhizobium sp. NFACC06-2]